MAEIFRHQPKQNQEIETFQLEQKTGVYVALADILKPQSLRPDVAEIILMERDLPIYITPDSSIRCKVSDPCGMTCTFCHNEGTPVTPSQLRRGRVSVFEKTNGVNFMPGAMMPDKSFASMLVIMREQLNATELHWTGGEPTLHMQLPELTRIATDLGYSVKITSNGETGERRLESLKDAGLQSINYSIFGTTPSELAEVQAAMYQDIGKAQKQIDSLDRGIEFASQLGIKTKANIVMSGPKHADRIKRLLDKYSESVSIRILEDLDVGLTSAISIYNLLAELKAIPIKRKFDAGASNAQTIFRLQNGREIGFKQIRMTRLHDVCNNCNLNNPDDCKEGYYGVRIYVDTQGQYKVGVCLQRMDLTVPIDDFMSTSIPESIKQLRQTEFEEMISEYGTKAVII